MNTLFFTRHKSIPLTFGELTIYLGDYAVTGVRQLVEAGTTEGSPAVTASWQKGTRITLTGTLPPDMAESRAAAALSQALRDGTAHNMAVDGIKIPAAVLCQYALKTGRTGTAVTLVLYTRGLLAQEEAAV